MGLYCTSTGPTGGLIVDKAAVGIPRSILYSARLTSKILQLTKNINNTKFVTYK